MTPRVTIYVPCRNYGRFLDQALRSVSAQSFDAWEAIVFTEGSDDDTVSLARSFAHAHPGRVRVVETPAPLGLRGCANQALEMARGEFILRLDADDVLDDAALLVLVDFLDRHPDVGLVYPNWIYISEAGDVIGVEHRKRVGHEAELLDLPAHGACTMIRRRVLKSVGGYDPQFGAQDGYELWLRLMGRCKVANVQTPLFSYRQHANSMSTDRDALHAARRAITRAMAMRHVGPVRPRCVVIVPVKNTYPHFANVALAPFAGSSLLDYTLDCARAAGCFDVVYLSSDDARVVAHAADRPKHIARLRDPRLSDPEVQLEEVVRGAVEDLEANFGVFPDILAILNVHTPLRRPEQVREALDTLLVHDVDQVVSTCEGREMHFRHGRRGLEPINFGARRSLRLEREVVYTGNGAVHVLWRDALRHAGLFDGRIGHIVMSSEDGLMAKFPEERMRAEALLRGRAAVETREEPVRDC